MSDIRFNQWLHQSGTGGVSQVASGAVGVGTTNPLADFYVRGDAQITGILTAGHIAMGSSITFGDDDRAYFGDGTDLQIYHSGSHSFIQDTGTGDLKIRSSNVRIEDTSGNLIINASPTTAYLYSSGNAKLGTAGWGVQVTGILKLADATDSSGATNHLALGASNDLKLFHDGSHNRIHGSTGFLDINNSADLISITASNRIDISDDFIRLRSRDGSDVYMTGTVNSSVDLYHNGNKKFETTVGGINVTGTTDTDNLNVAGVTTAAGSIVQTSGHTQLRSFSNPTSGAGMELGYDGTRAIIQPYDRDNSANKNLYIGGGNVGINQVNPTARLEVTGGIKLSGTLDANGDLDVDGHTNLDNVSIAGVTTSAGIVQASQFKLLDNAKAMYGNSGDMEIYHNATNSLIQNGTGSLQIVTTTGDLFFRGQDNITFNTAGNNERVRINSNGMMSIGKTSNAGKAIEIYQSSFAALRIQNSSTGTGNNDGILLEASGSDCLLYNYESANLKLGTAGTEKLRITSTGNLIAKGVRGLTVHNVSTADVEIGGRHIWNRIESTNHATTSGAQQFKIKFFRSSSSNSVTCYYKGVVVNVTAGGRYDWGGHGYVTHSSSTILMFSSTTGGSHRHVHNEGYNHINNTANGVNHKISGVAYSYDSNYLYATFSFDTNISGTGFKPYYNIEIIDPSQCTYDVEGI